MSGEVDDRGTPILHWLIDNREWVAVIDTGFDGFLVLPDSLVSLFQGPFWGQAAVTLGGGQVVDEDLFTIDFPFDGQMKSGNVSFCPVDEILIGTEFLQDQRLEINFVARTVALEKV